MAKVSGKRCGSHAHLTRSRNREALFYVIGEMGNKFLGGGPNQVGPAMMHFVCQFRNADGTTEEQS